MIAFAFPHIWANYKAVFLQLRTLIGIQFSFGGTIGVFVFGALLAASAAYLDGYYGETGRFGVLFFIGEIVMLFGGVLTALIYSTWREYWQKRISHLEF